MTLPRPQLDDFVLESNRIEGITREPTLGELAAHENLLNVDELTVAAVSEFVATICGEDLRAEVGMDVMVGKHVPPAGGPEIEPALTVLLGSINLGALDPWAAHVAYETLHPYLDGNGRSGRAIWAWHMLRAGRNPFALPFLHIAYYQALDASREAGA